MQRILVFLLLFTLPFLILPVGASQFETPKVIVAEIAIEILVFYYFVFAKDKLKISLPYLIFVAILFLLTIIDLIFLRTGTTFFGNQFRLQGIFLLWHLIGFSIVSSAISIDKLPQRVFAILFLFLVTCVLLLGNNPAGRAVGTLGEPNFLAATALFFWPFVLLGKKGTSKLLSLILVAGICLVLYLTRSHSAIIGFWLQIIFLLVTRLRVSTKAAVLMCVFLLLISYGLPFALPRLVYEDRSEVWQTGFYTALQKPIFGHGFGNVEQALKETSIALQNNVHFQYVDSGHNFLLDYFVSGGLVGLLVIVSLIFISLRKFIAEKNQRNVVLLLGILAVMSFNPVSVCTLLAFWWLLGQAAGTNKKIQ